MQEAKSQAVAPARGVPVPDGRPPQLLASTPPLAELVPNAVPEPPAPQAQPGQPDQWPAWYNRDLKPIPGIDRDSLSVDSSSAESSASSGSSSCSSSDSSSGKKPKKRQRVRRWRLKFGVHERLQRPLAPPLSHTIYKSESSSRRTFVHIPRLLDERNIRLVHKLWRHPSVEEIKDRRNTLLYRHVAYRMELPMRAHGQALYQRLLDTMAWADAVVWNRLQKNSKVYPEAEYIVYDARKGVPGEIEPHVDNHSAVTIVVLLSDPCEFQGGVNCFAPADGRGSGGRQLPLQQGDAVVFRGEKLQHWITPVTGGVRIILQIELSRI